MDDEFDRAVKLFGILNDRRIVGKEKTTITHQLSGDGHSFDDSTEEEVIEKDIYYPSYSLPRRLFARHQLRRILDSTDDTIVRKICEGGIEASKRTFSEQTSNYVIGAIALSFSSALLAYSTYRNWEYIAPKLGELVGF